MITQACLIEYTHAHTDRETFRKREMTEREGERGREREREGERGVYKRGHLAHPHISLPSPSIFILMGEGGREGGRERGRGRERERERNT